MQRPGRYYEALSSRGFALLWTGQSVSMLGDGIFTVALALEALRIDHSPGGLSLVLAARLVPMIAFLLVGGAIADRLSRRTLMLASDVVRGLAVGVAALLIFADAMTITRLVFMALIFGIADAAFWPSSTAIVPELVREDLLVNASALQSTSRTVAEMLIGPALGGVAVAALGTGWSFAADALSFGISAACMLGVPRGPSAQPSGTSALAEIREGIRFLAGRRWFWVTLIFAGLANFAAFSPMGVLMPLWIKESLHAGASSLGVVLAAGGAGGLVASLALARGKSDGARVAPMCLAWGFAGLANAGVAFLPSVLGAAVCNFLGAGAIVYGNTLWFPLMQTYIPKEMLGRASSVDVMFSLALSPIGVVVAGAVAGSIGTGATIAIGGLIAALTPVSLLVPGVRHPQRA